MKAIKLLAVILWLSLFNTCFTPHTIETVEKTNSDWNYVYKIAKNFVKEKYAKRYADVIVACSYKYDLKVKAVTHCVSNESKFDWRAKGDFNAVTGKYESFGPMQVKVKYHWRKLYKINNGELKEYFAKRRKAGKSVIYERYLCRIGYGVNVGCDLWRDLLDRYNQDYRLMIVAYGHGPDHVVMGRVKKNPNMIFNKKNWYLLYARRVLAD